ncbi:MAG: hypothetical protein QM687_12420 [Ferruginibacter sp.]
MPLHNRYTFYCTSLLLLAILSCKENRRETTAAPAISVTHKPAAVPYEEVTQKLRSKYKRFAAKKQQDSLHALLYNSISNIMPGYWNGTPWDFNGTTQMPGEGSIACGYFITTVLEHTGYPLNRVRLAQQPSSVLIEATCKKIKRFGSLKEAKTYIASLPDNSIGIAGLDFHTGFIIKNITGAYFFHSNYISRRGVMNEPLDASRAFAASKTFMIGVLN